MARVTLQVVALAHQGGRPNLDAVTAAIPSDDAEPTDEHEDRGGDPPCWAHLFDDEEALSVDLADPLRT